MKEKLRLTRIALYKKRFCQKRTPPTVRGYRHLRDLETHNPREYRPSTGLQRQWPPFPTMERGTLPAWMVEKRGPPMLHNRFVEVGIGIAVKKGDPARVIYVHL